jgi:hypothetical protein
MVATAFPCDREDVSVIRLSEPRVRPRRPHRRPRSNRRPVRRVCPSHGARDVPRPKRRRCTCPCRA